ncbi:YolD-like family protein [Bacillus paralicheniformis]|uniref:YolD-like family protein n=1 Tax=Bacillus paralicheniformis TaxID=1648923 RepID=UPI0021A90442|nr:YolD-like family protein [Bacillus paralicheniformis]UWS62645.1 YolD-like family protein [Bacillus paralicheniformis]
MRSLGALNPRLITHMSGSQRLIREHWWDFESKIQYAYRTGQACEIRYWRNWVAEWVNGVIDSVDPVGGALRIDGIEVPFREIVWVALEDI